MIEGIIEAVVSSILVAVLFELWAKREALAFWKKRSGSTPAPPVAPTAEPAQPTTARADSIEPKVAPVASANSSWTAREIAKIVIRLGIAATVGFVIGGCSAGVLEAEGSQQISLGSGASIIAIMIPTLLVWAILYRFGPLKSK